MTRLFLLRHGITDWNRQRRFQGQTDIPLAAEGLAQAHRLGLRFVGEDLAAVYSSDLSRAWQTAQPVAAACACPLIAERGLRERAFGVFEGLTHDAIVSDHGRDYQRWRARDWDFAISGGGESLRQLHARVLEAMSRLAQAHPAQSIALVTHGGVLDCAYRIAGGLPLLDPQRPRLMNAAINVVSYRPKQDPGDVGSRLNESHLNESHLSESGFTIDRWGDVEHLH